MEIKKDDFHIDQAPAEAVGGAKPEPEERTVAHVLGTEATLGLHGQQHTHRMETNIVAEMSADEALKILGKTCNRCKHFDTEKWHSLLGRLKESSNPTDVKYLNDLRVAYLTTDSGEILQRHSVDNGQMDPDHALSQMGICRIYGKACHAISTCPAGQLVQWEGKDEATSKDTQQKEQTMLFACQAANRR